MTVLFGIIPKLKEPCRKNMKAGKGIRICSVSLDGVAKTPSIL